MGGRLKSAGKLGALVSVLVLAAALGYALAGARSGAVTSGSTGPDAITERLATQKSATYGAVPQAGGVSAGAPSGAAGAPPTSQTEQGAASASTPAPQRMIVTNASMAVQVKNVDASVAAVRAVALASGSEISDLQVVAGSGGSPTPVPLDVSARAASSPTPATAQVTLRVPADKVRAVEAQIARLGNVTSQTSSQSDVTQQHIDLSARLKNLKAEEAQLRTFFRKAKSVDDLLSVQQQLSTVQGEIESMQAQADYLERQAALATLTLSLAEPGPVVRPSGTSWGFSAAVTAGVQAAAALMRALITVTIALSPAIIVALVLWPVWLAMRRRRRRASADDATDASDDVQPAEQPLT